MKRQLNTSHGDAMPIDILDWERQTKEAKFSHKDSLSELACRHMAHGEEVIYAMTLDKLGTRFCIMGPSNNGKLTFAEAIGRAQSLEVVHLDQLHHLPHTNLVPRPPEEFAGLHDKAITGDPWVIEGNYSRLLP